MSRALRPRATASLVVAPVLVTDRSAPAVLGLEAREYRELVAEHGIRHVRRGHRVIARVEDVLAALDRIAATQAEGESTHTEDPAGESQPETADDFLAAIGRRRTA